MRLQPARVRHIDRIVGDVSVEIDPPAEEDRVGLQEAPERGVMGAGAIVHEHARAETDLPRILEEPRIARARPAEFVIGVDLRGDAQREFTS